MDENGLLMDEDGNYILDEEGNFIKFDDEQLSYLEKNNLIEDD